MGLSTTNQWVVNGQVVCIRFSRPIIDWRPHWKKADTTKRGVWCTGVLLQFLLILFAFSILLKLLSTQIGTYTGFTHCTKWKIEKSSVRNMLFSCSFQLQYFVSITIRHYWHILFSLAI